MDAQPVNYRPQIREAVDYVSRQAVFDILHDQYHEAADKEVFVHDLIRVLAEVSVNAANAMRHVLK